MDILKSVILGSVNTYRLKYHNNFLLLKKIIKNNQHSHQQITNSQLSIKLKLKLIELKTQVKIKINNIKKQQ